MWAYYIARIILSLHLYCRVIFFSNNNRLLHKHLLWQGHNLVIGARSWVDYCLWSVKTVQTKHNTCPLSGPRWWLVRVGVHQGSLAIDGWKSNFNRSCEINDSPGITSQREAEQWFWFQIRYLSHTIFFQVSFIHCMT